MESRPLPTAAATAFVSVRLQGLRTHSLKREHCLWMATSESSSLYQGVSGQLWTSWLRAQCSPGRWTQLLGQSVLSALSPPHHLSLPLPAISHPSRICHPPWTHPHPLNLWPFLKVRPHSLGSGHFSPREAAKNGFREFLVTILLHCWFTKKETEGEHKVKDSRMGRHRRQVPQRPTKS